MKSFLLPFSSYCSSLSLTDERMCTEYRLKNFNDRLRLLRLSLITNYNLNGCPNITSADAVYSGSKATNL